MTIREGFAGVRPNFVALCGNDADDMIVRAVGGKTRAYAESVLADIIENFDDREFAHNIVLTRGFVEHILAENDWDAEKLFEYVIKLDARVKV